VAMQAVTEDPSRTLPPGQVRNAIPALSFPHDVTLAPSPQQQPENTTAPRPAFDPPPRRRWPLIAGVVVAVLGVVAVAAWPKAAPPIATLEINLDQPAVIAVD